MEFNLERSQAPVRDAATVVLLRDGAQGLEVFMLRRHAQSDVLGGAYVFPGGKVDEADLLAQAQGLLDLPDAQLHASLGEPALSPGQAAAVVAAALREMAEECGVRLAASALVPWTRWITPPIGGVMRKRFDTRFFLAAHPEDQVAVHDNHEADASAWLRPREALARYWSREIELAPPQIQGLAHLARHAGVDAALAEARTRLPPLVQPEPFQEDGARGMCYPGDPRHPVRERAFPGPSRLHLREGRLEPPGGFEGFFSEG